MTWTLNFNLWCNVMHACFGLIVVFLLWWHTPLFFGVHVSKFLLIITESHIGIAITILNFYFVTGCYYFLAGMERGGEACPGTLGHSKWDYSFPSWLLLFYMRAGGLLPLTIAMNLIINLCQKKFQLGRILELLNASTLLAFHGIGQCWRMPAFMSPLYSVLVGVVHCKTNW